MTRDIKDIITDFREIVKPRIAKMLLEANFEGCGKEDKAEFETEFEMLLTLAERGATVEAVPLSAIEDIKAELQAEIDKMPVSGKSYDEDTYNSGYADALDDALEIIDRKVNEVTDDN